MTPSLVPANKPEIIPETPFRAKNTEVDRKAFDEALRASSQKSILLVAMNMAKMIYAIKQAIKRGDMIATNNLGAKMIAAYKNCQSELLKAPSMSIKARSLALVVKSSAIAMNELSGQALAPVFKRQIKSCTEDVMMAIEFKKSNRDYLRSMSYGPH